MEPRLNVHEVAPEAYKPLLALEKYLGASPLPTPLLHLVKLRASQINGCSFCVDMHAHEAKHDGETDERIYAVAAWREAPFFTDAERAALRYAEEGTRLADRGENVADEVWQPLTEHFDEAQLAALVVALATINAWNRIAISTRQVAGSLRKAGASA